MQELIRLIDVSLYNNNHHGLTFTSDSDINKYFRDNKIGFTYKYEEWQKMCYEPERAKFHGKINMVERCDIYGDVTQTIVYDENLEELLSNIKRGIKIIPSRFGENKYCTVELFEQKYDLLDGSSVYEIGLDKVLDADGTDITDMHYDKICLIINMPIISYH